MSKPSPWIFDVAEAEFDEKVLKKSHEVPVIVDFWAPWCGPCRSLAPILEAAIEKRNGEVLLAKANTDDAQNLAMQYGVSGIPHVVGFRKGRAVVQFTWACWPRRANQRMPFDRWKPTEAGDANRIRGRAGENQSRRSRGDVSAALKNDSNQEDAIVGLARLLVEQKKHEEASDLLDRASAPAASTAPRPTNSARSFGCNSQAKELPSENDLQKKVKANPKDAQPLCDLGCVMAANGKTVEGLEALAAGGQSRSKVGVIESARDDGQNLFRDRRPQRNGRRVSR